MPLYNPPIIPSSTSQYQLTASYLSSSFSSNTASLFIQSDEAFSQGLVILSPTVETSGKATSFQISAGSASDGSVSGDLYLYTKNCGSGNPGSINIQTGGRTSTVSGSLKAYSTNIVICNEITENNNYLKIDNTRTNLKGLQLTASSNVGGILLDAPIIYKDGIERTNYMVRNFTSADAIQFDQTIYTTNYGTVGHAIDVNLIFLNSSISNATASNMRTTINSNDSAINAPIGTIVELYNSSSYDIYLKHDQDGLFSTRLKLSGSVSRSLKTKSSIRFVLDSDNNWYELWR